MSALGPALRFVLSLLAAALCAPLFAQVPGKAYAQELVDRTVARHPGLLAVTLHATPSGGGEPVMIASTIGRIGHPAGGRRVDVALPLLDTTGIVVGTLGLSWLRRHDTDEAAVERDAVAIRDQLARSILNARNLLERYPFVSGATTKTKAQRLVDEIVAREPSDLRAVTLRGFSGGQLMILGSTFGRHGKKADEDDMKVLHATEPQTGLHVDGRRFNVDISLRDAAGKPMGTLTVGYAYRKGDDTQALVARALALRKQIEATAADGVLDALDATLDAELPGVSPAP